MIESLHAIFDMGKHGFYVWSAYAISAIVLVSLLLITLRQRKKIIEDLKEEQILKSMQKKASRVAKF